MAYPEHANGQQPSPLARSNNAANYTPRRNTPLPLPTQSVPTLPNSPITYPDSLGQPSQYETQPNNQFAGQSTHHRLQYEKSSHNLPTQNLSSHHLPRRRLTPRNPTLQNPTPPNLTPQNLAPQNLAPPNLTPRNPTLQNLTPPNLTPQNLTPQNLAPQRSPFQNLPPRGPSFQSSLTAVPPANLQQPRIPTERKKQKTTKRQKEQKESTLQDKLKDADERTKLLMDYVGLTPNTDCSYDDKEKAANKDFANSLEKTVSDMKAVELAPHVDDCYHDLDADKLQNAAKDTHKSVLQLLSKLKKVTVTPKKRRAEDLDRNAGRPTESEKRPKQLVMSHVTYISTQPMTPCKSVNAQQMPTPDSTQSASQTENQSVLDEAVIPVQDDEQINVDPEADVIDDEETAANTVPEKPSAPTANRATSALEMQNLDQQSDPADETPRRQRTTRAATQAKRPAARKPRKKANEFIDIPFYICLPDINLKYEPIATLPNSVQETLLSAYNKICRHKDHEVRYARMTRNPATYSEKRSSSCVFVQLIGHGRNSSRWANGDRDFACDGCSNSDRLCVRICSMAEIRTGGSSEEYGLCISPVPKPDRLTDDCKSAGFWLAEDVGG